MRWSPRRRCLGCTFLGRRQMAPDDRPQRPHQPGPDENDEHRPGKLVPVSGGNEGIDAVKQTHCEQLGRHHRAYEDHPGIDLSASRLGSLVALRRQQAEAAEGEAHRLIPATAASRAAKGENENINRPRCSGPPQHPAGPGHGKDGRSPFERCGGIEIHDAAPRQRVATMTNAPPGDRELHHGGNQPYLSRTRSRALSASTSRSRAGALVCSEVNSRRAASVTSATAWLKAASLACDGLPKPDSFRTYCNAEARISSSAAGGSKLNSVLMLRHI